MRRSPCSLDYILKVRARRLLVLRGRLRILQMRNFASAAAAAADRRIDAALLCADARVLDDTRPPAGFPLDARAPLPRRAGLGGQALARRGALHVGILQCFRYL